MSRIWNQYAYAMLRAFNIQPPSRLAISVSGGVDSMALTKLTTDWAKPLNIELTALIVDHKLRSNSTEEANSVCEYIKSKFGISAEVLNLDMSLDSINSTRIEEIARQQRRNALQTACDRLNVNRILFGHHLNDQVELFIIRLLKNSSWIGLAGMSEVTAMNWQTTPFRKEPLKIVRPLLEVSKKDLIEVCESNSIKWWEDQSNQDTQLTQRNLIRRMYQSGQVPNGFTIEKIKKLMSYLAEQRELVESNAGMIMPMLTKTSRNAKLDSVSSESERQQKKKKNSDSRLESQSTSDKVSDLSSAPKSGTNGSSGKSNDRSNEISKVKVNTKSKRKGPLAKNNYKINTLLDTVEPTINLIPELRLLPDLILNEVLFRLIATTSPKSDDELFKEKSKVLPISEHIKKDEPIKQNVLGVEVEVDSESIKLTRENWRRGRPYQTRICEALPTWSRWELIDNRFWLRWKLKSAEVEPKKFSIRFVDEPKPILDLFEGSEALDLTKLNDVCTKHPFLLFESPDTLHTMNSSTVIGFPTLGITQNLDVEWRPKLYNFM